ncbi:hypothetical protein [Gordonia sp. KTR9]|uniref:hypothetical protein n=1 Tax=Gordonia sp. KTR9 TaxID=337191 RepID=UPI00027DDEB1|nr:hypothetical protein [Gordonia sp. KTR9]AFR50018.1 hypothetical protein KTR9_3383 [Gordonia sp. KTR9]
MTLRQPKGLGYQGKKLWKSITDEFDLDAEPHKIRILFDACKMADAIDRLDKEADKAPLVAKGSYGQPVLHPAFSGAQTARAALAALLARLNFEEATPDE